MFFSLLWILHSIKKKTIKVNIGAKLQQLVTVYFISIYVFILLYEDSVKCVFVRVLLNTVTITQF